MSYIDTLKDASVTHPDDLACAESLMESLSAAVETAKEGIASAIQPLLAVTTVFMLLSVERKITSAEQAEAAFRTLTTNHSLNHDEAVQFLQTYSPAAMRLARERRLAEAFTTT